MNESSWLECRQVGPLLEYIHDRVSDRKRRLNLCGGSRQIAHLFFAPESMAGVEVGERFADGEASEEVLDKANWLSELPTFGYELGRSLSWQDPLRQRALSCLVKLGMVSPSALAGGEWWIAETDRELLLAAAELAWSTCHFPPIELSQTIRFIARVKEWPGRWLVDCVFGNPFHPVHFENSWRTSLVIERAKRAYADRIMPSGELNPTLLLALADALEKAGCTHLGVLSHLRGQEKHVRGCWVVDGLLEKQEQVFQI